MGMVQFSPGYRKPFREDSLIAMPPKISGTHLIDLRGMKDCVNLGAARWIRNPEFSVSIFEDKHNNSIDLFVPQNVNPHQFLDENGFPPKSFCSVYFVF